MPKDVVHFLLSNYIQQCRKKHAIAFLEWRQHFSKSRTTNDSSTQMNNKDIEEIIGERISYLKEEFKALSDEIHLED